MKVEESAEALKDIVERAEKLCEELDGKLKKELEELVGSNTAANTSFRILSAYKLGLEMLCQKIDQRRDSLIEMCLEVEAKHSSKGEPN